MTPGVTSAVCLQNLRAAAILEAVTTHSGKGPEDVGRYRDLGTGIFTPAQFLSEKLETALVPNKNEQTVPPPYNDVIVQLL